MLTTEQQQQADADLHSDKHEATRNSVLEPHRVAIVKMREAEWPYRKIARWLKDQGRASINAETVRSFCVVRKIVKGATTPSSSKEPKELDPRRKRIAERIARHQKKKEEEKVFTYDGFDKPIRTWKDEV